MHRAALISPPATLEPSTESQGQLMQAQLYLEHSKTGGQGTGNRSRKSLWISVVPKTLPVFISILPSPTCFTVWPFSSLLCLRYVLSTVNAICFYTPWCNSEPPLSSLWDSIFQFVIVIPGTKYNYTIGTDYFSYSLILSMFSFHAIFLSPQTNLIFWLLLSCLLVISVPPADTLHSCIYLGQFHCFVYIWTM